MVDHAKELADAIREQIAARDEANDGYIPRPGHDEKYMRRAYRQGKARDAVDAALAAYDAAKAGECAGCGGSRVDGWIKVVPCEECGCLRKVEQVTLADLPVARKLTRRKRPTGQLPPSERGV